MLGGKNKYRYDGDLDIWHILASDTIITAVYLFEEKGFTLEEFLEKFPYKVGDKVVYLDENDIAVITEIMWDNTDSNIYYNVKRIDEDDCFWCPPELLKLYKEKTMEEKFEQIIINIPNGYEFFEINDDNKIVLTKKQPQYPKTFIEVLNFWHPDRQSEDDYQRCYKKDLIEKFQDLLYVRDAYWKIAGEQMRLGKTWKPDWKNAGERKYCIVNTEGNITKWVQKTTNKIFAFPTEEMRDVFYENFKDLIEECKEFL